MALFLMGALAFSPPLLFIFSAERSILGVPLLYLYLFVGWLALIVLTGVLAGRRRLGERDRTYTDKRPEQPEGQDDA